EENRDLALECRIASRRVQRELELVERRNQRLGDVASAEHAEAVRDGGHRRHRVRAPSAASRKARIFSGSFIPVVDSTPEDTSTTSGASVETARSTLSGRSPPASTNFARRERSDAT